MTPAFEGRENTYKGYACLRICKPYSTFNRHISFNEQEQISSILSRKVRVRSKNGEKQLSKVNFWVVFLEKRFPQN